jgi:hypothetical protein
MAEVYVLGSFARDRKDALAGSSEIRNERLCFIIGEDLLNK